MKECKCGCKEMIPDCDKKRRTRYFKDGHQNRGRIHKRLPVMEGINLCHCGCGMSIPWYGRRRQILRFKKGHSKDNKSHFKSGSEHPRWIGGRIIGRNGYVYIRLPNHPRAINVNGYVREHVLIMEKHLGRFLKDDEVVHHINKNKQDNRIENLKLMNRIQHDIHHLLERKQKLEKEGKWL